MSQPKCRDIDYIDFLIASPRTASCCEAARSRPPRLVPPTHDAYTRLIQRLEPDPETLYAEVEPLVKRDDGVIVLDDSTLDHLDAKKIQAVHRHWSGKHKRVVWGINLISLVWSDGDRTLPVDYRILDKPVDDLTKNDHFQAMVRTAKRRGFSPRAVLLQRRAVPGPLDAGATQPHRHGDPSVRAVVVALLHHRDQLVRGKGPNRPRSDSDVSLKTAVQNSINCVISIAKGISRAAR